MGKKAQNAAGARASARDKHTFRDSDRSQTLPRLCVRNRIEEILFFEIKFLFCHVFDYLRIRPPWISGIMDDAENDRPGFSKQWRVRIFTCFAFLHGSLLCSLLPSVSLSVLFVFIVYSQCLYLCFGINAKKHEHAISNTMPHRVNDVRFPKMYNPIPRNLSVPSDGRPLHAASVSQPLRAQGWPDACSWRRCLSPPQ